MAHPLQSQSACKELEAAAVALQQAVFDQDFDAIKEHDHRLRNAAMAVVGAVPMDQEGINQSEAALVGALHAVRAAATWLEEHMSTVKTVQKKTERIRLVYANKDKGAA